MATAPATEAPSIPAPATEVSSGGEPDLLEAARRARVGAGELALWNTGGAGFIVRSARTTLLIDPFLGPSNPPDWVRAVAAPFSAPALRGVDAMLMTHEHDDHADPVVLAALAARSGSALAIGPDRCTDIARRAGMPAARCLTLSHDAAIDVGEIKVRTARHVGRERSRSEPATQFPASTAVRPPGQPPSTLTQLTQSLAASPVET